MTQKKPNGFEESDRLYLEQSADRLIDGYPEHEFAAIMEEAKASPLIGRSIDDIFTEIFEKQFGRKPELDAGSAHVKSNTRL